MRASNNVNSGSSRILDSYFDKLRIWMTASEIKNYKQRACKPGIILSMIHDRFQQNTKLFKDIEYEHDVFQLKTLVTDLEKSMQVSHFFYQLALVQFHEAQRKTIESIHLLGENLKSDL